MSSDIGPRHEDVLHDPNLLSTKSIPSTERLIFALDVPGPDEARSMAAQLGNAVQFYKIGLELFMAGGYWELVEDLIQDGKKVFADLKFFDVPQTVASAVRRLSGRGVTFTTVHGNEAILRAACEARQGVKILAVTVLTSLDEGDLRDLGFSCNPQELVLSRAKRALALGCDGIVSSGLEAPAIRESLGDKLVVVTPGIRPVSNVDDQKRTVNVEQAFRNGADYIVVGRPIRDAPDPRAAAQAVQETIAGIFT